LSAFFHIKTAPGVAAPGAEDAMTLTLQNQGPIAPSLYHRPGGLLWYTSTLKYNNRLAAIVP